MTALVITAACLVVIGLVLLAAGHYFYNVGIRRSSKEFLSEDPALIKNEHPWDTEEKWMQSQRLETVRIQSFDGLGLTGYYISSEQDSGCTAIVVHGYSSQGREMGAFAKMYVDMGMNVLLPDNRGHGESEGDYIGFGWHDRKDIMEWIRYIIGRSGQNVRIVLHGVSMGGATVLMASGESLPQQVKCIVSDCAYTSVKDVLTHQLKQMYKLPPFPLLPITSLICKIRAGYTFGEASALRQVANKRLPVLFIHGDQDKFVPYEMVHRLAAAATGEKELFIAANAEHANSLFTDREGYIGAVQRFVSRYLDQESIRLSQ